MLFLNLIESKNIHVRGEKWRSWKWYTRKRGKNNIEEKILNIVVKGEAFLKETLEVKQKNNGHLMIFY